MDVEEDITMSHLLVVLSVYSMLLDSQLRHGMINATNQMMAPAHRWWRLLPGLASTSFPLLHERVIFAAASDESTVEADKGWVGFIGGDSSSRVIQGGVNTAKVE